MPYSLLNSKLEFRVSAHRLPPLADRLRRYGAEANHMTESSVFLINEADARTGGVRWKYFRTYRAPPSIPKIFAHRYF